MSKVSPSLSECEVCCEKRIVITCPYAGCHYKACGGCYEKVILSSINKPSCMSCKKQFNDDFFHSKFSNSFIKKKYKAHRENVLFRYEESLLPETQIHVERIYENERLKKELSEMQMIDMDDNFDVQKMNRVRFRQIELRERIYRNTHALPSLSDEKEEKKESFVGPCPDNDCRGYLSNKYKCGICGVKACPDCREVKKDHHECDQDTVKTIEELKKSCRQCPNCMTMIFRISGCDQMWCTKCKTAFNWKTGEIEKGMIHNPHFFQWMSENQGGVPRNPLDMVCGGRADYIGMLSYIQRYNIQFEEDKKVERWNIKWVYPSDVIQELFRQVIHAQEVTMRGLPTALDNTTNQDLRIDFLMKTITKEEFKRKLQRREKDRNKKLEYRQVLEMYTTVLNESFHTLVNKFRVGILEKDTICKIYTTFIEEEKKLKEYTNKSIEKIRNKYSSKGLASIQ